jgi:hypothetical protein
MKNENSVNRKLDLHFVGEKKDIALLRCESGTVKFHMRDKNVSILLLSGRFRGNNHQNLLDERKRVPLSSAQSLYECRAEVKNLRIFLLNSPARSALNLIVSSVMSFVPNQRAKEIYTES